MKVYPIFLILLQTSFFISSCGGDEGATHLNALNTDSLTPVLYWGSCDNGAVTNEVEKNVKDGKSHIHAFSKPTCREWYGDFFSNINLQMTCNSVFEGEFSSEYCEQKGALGICIVSMEKESETRVYYDTDHWSADSAEKHCNEYGPTAQWSRFGEEI